MPIDVDLLQTGLWTQRLTQAEISVEELERARLYGLHEDVHVRALAHSPARFEILGSPKIWLLAQMLQQQTVSVKHMDYLSSAEIDGYYGHLINTEEHFIDRALALKQRIKRQNISLTMAGALIGKSRSEVCNLMRILNIEKHLLDNIKQCSMIGFGHAKIMAGLPLEQQQLLLQQIKDEHLTVQQTEAVARTMRAHKPVLQPSASVKKSADVLALETRLTEHFGAHVDINEDQGVLIINYHRNLDILQGVLDKMALPDI